MISNRVCKCAVIACPQQASAVLYCRAVSTLHSTCSFPGAAAAAGTCCAQACCAAGCGGRHHRQHRGARSLHRRCCAGRQAPGRAHRREACRGEWVDLDCLSVRGSCSGHATASCLQPKSWVLACLSLVSLCAQREATRSLPVPNQHLCSTDYSPAQHSLRLWWAACSLLPVKRPCFCICCCAAGGGRRAVPAVWSPCALHRTRVAAAAVSQLRESSKQGHGSSQLQQLRMQQLLGESGAGNCRGWLY